MRKKIFFLYFAIIVLFIWAVSMEIAVYSISLSSLRTLLFSWRNGIYVSRLYASSIYTVSLFIICVILCLGTFGIFIMSSSTIPNFLECMLLFIVSAGLVASSWNQDILFFASPKLRRLILLTHDAMYILYAFFAVNLVASWCIFIPEMRKTSLVLNGVFTGITLLPLLFVKSINLSPILLCYGIVLLVDNLILYSMQYHRPDIPQSFQPVIFLCVPPALFVILRALLMYSPGNPFYEAFHRYSMITVVLFTFILATYTLVRHHTTLFFRKSQNRRFQEVLNTRTQVIDLLVRYCEQPLEQISALSYLTVSPQYGELTDKQKEILYILQDEIHKLQQRLSNVKEFESVPVSLSRMQKIRINLGTVFGYVLEEMDAKGLLVIDGVADWQEAYGLGEPFSLIRANVLLLSGLMPLRSEGEIHLTLKTDEAHYKIEIAIPVCNRLDAGNVERVRKILSRGSIFYGIEQDEDVSLYVAHNIIAAHSSPPQIELRQLENTSQLVCSYYLLRYDEAGETEVSRAEERHGAALPDSVENGKKVILLSSSLDEIELIRSYTLFEPYTMIVCQSETELLRSLNDLRDVAVVIIGTTFLSSTVYNLCWLIREQYTMGILPILLLQNDPNCKTHLTALELANDIITGPPERLEFCQKVKAMIELHNSMKNTVQSRLAFLQAQMDPHFIFNTMNTIMAMCLDQPMKAYDLIGYFSQYLRCNLFSTELGKPMPLFREINLIEAYLTIENARFENVIDYSIANDAPEDLDVLPMLIEPLVENSVKHGLMPNKKLKISVAITFADNTLNVSVKDNGKGFVPGQKQKQQQSASKEDRRSIGLENIRTRLQLFYNETLEISSTVGEGTCASFTLRNIVKEN